MPSLTPDQHSPEIYGRAWILPGEVQTEFWDHRLEPMEGLSRPASEWAKYHFDDLQEEYLREIFNLPDEGAFQVIFKGKMRGWMSGYECPEWDEEFELDTFEAAPIPDEYLKIRFPKSEQEKFLG